MRELKRLNAWLNGAALRDVDGRIHIVNITENAPDQELSWTDAPGRSGQRLMGRRRTNQRITIEFDIRELFDLAARASIVDAVNAWARDGILEVSYRPEQRIRVVLGKAAELGGARDVTGSYTLDFDTTGVPFWESAAAVTWSASGTGANIAGTMAIPGSVETWPDVSITPTGGTLNTITVAFGNSSMSFEGLNVGSGTKMTITHDDQGLLVVKAGSTSKLSCRTAVSADELEAGPGSVRAAYLANVACSVTFSARGRFR